MRSFGTCLAALAVLLLTGCPTDGGPGGEEGDVTIDGVGFDTAVSADMTQYAVSMPTDTDLTFTGYGDFDSDYYAIDYVEETIEEVPCTKVTMTFMDELDSGQTIETEAWVALATDGALYLLRSIDFGEVHEDLRFIAPAEISTSTPSWETPLGETFEVTGVGVATASGDYDDAYELTNSSTGVRAWFVAGVGPVEFDYTALFGTSTGFVLD